jgi:DNA mismatch endonuclease (patch repair protein)
MIKTQPIKDTLNIKNTYIRDGRAPVPKKETTSRIMSANKGKNTKPELMLRKALYNNGLSGYRLHWKKVPGRPDICYPGKKIAIFVNGCFWHRCPKCNPPMPKSNKSFWQNKFQKNIDRDRRNIKDLEEGSWRVFIFWECEINDNVLDCVDELTSVLV